MRRNRLDQTIPTRAQLDLAVAQAADIAAMKKMPGWALYESHVRRMIEVETNTLLDTPVKNLITTDPVWVRRQGFWARLFGRVRHDPLLSPDAIALQQNVRGMARALAVTDKILEVGQLASSHLADGKFRG